MAISNEPFSGDPPANNELVNVTVFVFVLLFGLIWLRPRVTHAVPLQVLVSTLMGCTTGSASTVSVDFHSTTVGRPLLKTGCCTRGSGDGGFWSHGAGNIDVMLSTVLKSVPTAGEAAMSNVLVIE